MAHGERQHTVVDGAPPLPLFRPRLDEAMSQLTIQLRAQLRVKGGGGEEGFLLILVACQEPPPTQHRPCPWYCKWPCVSIVMIGISSANRYPAMSSSFDGSMVRILLVTNSSSTHQCLSA